MINYDGSTKDNSCGCGWIIRDAKGNFIISYVGPLPNNSMNILSFPLFYVVWSYVFLLVLLTFGFNLMLYIYFFIWIIVMIRLVVLSYSTYVGILNNSWHFLMLSFLIFIGKAMLVMIGLLVMVQIFNFLLIYVKTICHHMLKDLID